MKKFEKSFLEKIYVPSGEVHKGENGKVLVIGGSKLFHAAAFWPAEVASRVVDLVHFSSPAEENNDLVRKKAKEIFWSGIVVSWSEIEDYIREDEALLIGPGMPRVEGEMDGDVNTKKIVNGLLSDFPEKRWVIDGGALQEVDPKLLKGNMIITPHRGEFERVFGEKVEEDLKKRVEQVKRVSREHDKVVILLKGKVDVVSDGKRSRVIEGGNAGMTKGGTGDVLAGLVVSLCAKSSVFEAVVVSSYVNKKAGDMLFEEVGPYYNANELVLAVAEVLAEELGF